MVKTSNIAIITDDSPCLAPFSSRKDRLRRGLPITSMASIISLLSDQGLPVPSTNIELEATYREVLKPYIRQAGDAFSGSFLEVKSFLNSIKETEQANLFVVSQRYGLLNELDTVLPYASNMRTANDYSELDKRTNYSDQIGNIALCYDTIIFFIPLALGSYLISKGVLHKMSLTSKIFLVTSIKLRDFIPDREDIVILPRKGVARIGKQNREELMNTMFN